MDHNRLFNDSPSAISGQVYATALVYDGLRLAQAEIAQKVDMEPERLSLEKRNDRRRKRRFCKCRRQFTFYSKIPGAKKYVSNELSGLRS